MMGLASVVLLVAGGWLPVWAFLNHAGSLTTLSVALVAIVIVGIGLMWLAGRPPSLKADASEVRYRGPLMRRRIPRADVLTIIRGKAFAASRNYRGWLPCYAFIGAGGSVGIVVPARWFGDDAMSEFAQRLGIPLRGDFSEAVPG